MQHIIEIIEEITAMASRRGDRELLMIIKKKFSKLNSEYPELTMRLSRIISSAGGTGATRNFQQLGNTLRDNDSGLELIQRYDVSKDFERPILPNKTNREIDRFLLERSKSQLLQDNGILPPSSLALSGSPGTGKTTLSKWLAGQLGLPLLTLNIAAVITSYLGQTGQNIKKALDAARSEPSILLLDEFDALGSQRNSDNDIGEMKRIVTVLLQEIEEWPTESLIIAATNIPETLDSAFRRRFSKWIELPLPDCETREQILQKYLGNKNIAKELLQTIAELFNLSSGADIKEFSRRVKALAVVEDIPLKEALIKQLSIDIDLNEIREECRDSFIIAARLSNPRNFTLRKLANLTGISHTTVARIIQQKVNNVE